MKGIKTFILVMTLILLTSITVMAKEEALTLNQVVTMQGDTPIMEKADKDSSVVGTVPGGQAAVVIEESVNGWVKVKYQETEGYIQVSDINFEPESGLEAEFDEISNQMMLYFENMQLEISQRRQKLIWGSVIVILVIAMFGVGIASAILKTQKEKQDQ